VKNSVKTISIPDIYACSTANSLTLSCAGATVSTIAGYTIQEYYQTGSLSATNSKTIDNTKAFNISPTVSCFTFQIIPSTSTCIVLTSGFTTTVGLSPTSCTTTTTLAEPSEILNYTIRATSTANPAVISDVPVSLELRHECYLTTLTPPKGIIHNYTFGNSSITSGDM
jgi:hypothetical protein